MCLYVRDLQKSFKLIQYLETSIHPLCLVLKNKPPHIWSNPVHSSADNTKEFLLLSLKQIRHHVVKNTTLLQWHCFHTRGQRRRTSLNKIPRWTVCSQQLCVCVCVVCEGQSIKRKEDVAATRAKRKCQESHLRLQKRDRTPGLGTVDICMQGRARARGGYSATFTQLQVLQLPYKQIRASLDFTWVNILSKYFGYSGSDYQWQVQLTEGFIYPSLYCPLLSTCCSAHNLYYCFTPRVERNKNVILCMFFRTCRIDYKAEWHVLTIINFF